MHALPNEIAVSNFTIATRKWAELYKFYSQVICHTLKKRYTVALQKGCLLKPACALSLEISHQESSANCFKHQLTDFMRLDG